MKNKKVELDLETVLRSFITWLLTLAVCWAGMSLILGRVATLQQGAGALLLVLAVYLLMPTRDEER